MMSLLVGFALVVDTRLAKIDGDLRLGFVLGVVVGAMFFSGLS